MTPEEKQLFEKALSAIGALEESIKKLSDDNAGLVEKIGGLEKSFADSQKVTAEKLQSEKVELEKKLDDLKTEIGKQIEKGTGSTGEIRNRCTEIETQIKAVSKIYESICKRMGIKNSIEIAEAGEPASGDGADPFGDALKAKPKKPDQKA